MAQRLGQLVACLQLTRIGLALTAVSNIWLVALLSRALPAGHPAAGPAHDLPLWRYLLLTGGAAVGMYVFGMTLNDVMDLRRDRLFAPDKPLPSRRVRPAAATALAIGALLLAIAASLPLGNRSAALCIITAGLVLFYNGPAKRLSGLGVLTLGLIRVGNMLVANPAFPFAWPIWLTMTHIVGLSALCHRLEGKRPTLTGGHVWLVTLGWAFFSLVTLEWLSRSGTAEARIGRMWVGPTALALAFVAVAAWTCLRLRTPQRAGMTLMKQGLIWLIAYDAAWLAGAGLWKESLLVASLLPATWLLIGALRVLKLLAQPMPRFHYTPPLVPAEGLDHPPPDR